MNLDAVLARPAVLAMLRAAFPSYTFSVIVAGDERRYEAVRKRNATGPLYCLISVSPDEIWHELAAQRLSPDFRLEGEMT